MQKDPWGRGYPLGLRTQGRGFDSRWVRWFYFLKKWFGGSAEIPDQTSNKGGNTEPFFDRYRDGGMSAVANRQGRLKKNVN